MDLETLSIYYNELFPWETYHAWLQYGDDEYFKRREFALVLDGDIFIRHKSFDNAKALKDEVKRLNPVRIEIGPVYDIEPKLKKKGAIAKVPVPEQKELVFDIDADDYADVFIDKEEGSGAFAITSKTWPLMAISLKVLDDLLKTDFGFDNVLYVFSGRRGVHAWVSDNRARALTNKGRFALSSFPQKQGANKAELGDNVHPSLLRVYNTILLPCFTEYMVDKQNLFNNEEHMERLMEFAPSSKREQFSNILDADTSSIDKWERTKLLFKDQERVIMDLVFTYTYPRLDANVTRQLVHLLKSPFVIHPKTDINNIFDFKPEDVLTLHAAVAANHSNNTKDLKKFNTHMQIFKTFVDNLQSEALAEPMDLSF